MLLYHECSLFADGYRARNILKVMLKKEESEELEQYFISHEKYLHHQVFLLYIYGVHFISFDY